MFKLLTLLFILIPVVEIYLFIEIGSRIGSMPTILLILGTAMLGIIPLRLQGLYILSTIRQEILHGQLPAVALLEGMILCLAGSLLLTPGFFTDMVGFLCLIPTVRLYLASVVAQRMIISQFKVAPQRPSYRQVGTPTSSEEFCSRKDH